MAYNNSGNYKYNNSNNRQTRTISQDFYNPYAFVPLNTKVCLLDEREKGLLEQIQDVPFKEGLSGRITVDFEAKAPFCVRSADGKNTQISGSYFVPGTSIKGMIRSVFEIISCSNIRNGIANNRYSMRDLRNSAYELKSTKHPQHSGFLVQINSRYFIQKCDSTSYKYYDGKKHVDIQSYASFKQGKDSRDLQKGRSVREKYGLLDTPFVEYDEGGKGMWFFSGFMNNKKHEFLFDIPVFDESDLIPLNEKEYNDFIFIHEKENENESWKFWKRRLKNYSSIEEIEKDNYMGIVPCFFRTNDEDTAVRDLGFSFLYRQPYSKTIHDFLPQAYQKVGIDFAQSVFGYVNGSEALKGRVQFGNSFIQNASIVSSQTFILGSPKPTYYPFYLEQNTPNKLETYFSKNTRISGYKRYLQQGNARQGNEPISRVTTTFVPMAAGTRFATNIFFHNLRDYELGALIAAITFCNHSECYHSLGFAKPFGYGKIKMNQVKVDLATGKQVDYNYLYKSFVSYICKKCGFENETLYLQSIKSLFQLASGNYSSQKNIKYPNMPGKEFDLIKNNRLSIKDFSPQIK